MWIENELEIDCPTTYRHVFVACFTTHILVIKQAKDIVRVKKAPTIYLVIKSIDLPISGKVVTNLASIELTGSIIIGTTRGTTGARFDIWVTTSTISRKNMNSNRFLTNGQIQIADYIGLSKVDQF